MEVTEEKQVLSKVGDVLTDKPDPVKIEFDVPLRLPKGFFKKTLVKWGLIKLKQKRLSYTLRPILVGNRFRIASRAVKFPRFLDTKSIIRAVYESTIKVNEDLIYITAVAIQNDREEPSEELLAELRWLDDKEFARVLDVSLSNLDIQSFIKSIISIVGADVLSATE